MSKEAMKLALEALERVDAIERGMVTTSRHHYQAKEDTTKAITALREALAEQPAQRKPLTDWIDPNDKTQKQYLPHIGEPVLFCHGGKTYMGKHNGGSFQTEGDYANYFDTWECHWMHLPSAHGIKEQP